MYLAYDHLVIYDRAGASAVTAVARLDFNIEIYSQNRIPMCYLLHSSWAFSYGLTRRYCKGFVGKVWGTYLHMQLLHSSFLIFQAARSHRPTPKEVRFP